MSQDLFEALRLATDGLLYPSEADYPVRPVYLAGWKPEIEFPRDALHLGDYSPGAVAAIGDYDRFFKPVVEEKDWFGQEEIARAGRFRHLMALLDQNLTGMQVVRIGSVTVDVYVVGRTPSGDLAGIATTVVET